MAVTYNLQSTKHKLLPSEARKAKDFEKLDKKQSEDHHEGLRSVDHAYYGSYSWRIQI